MVLYYKGWTRTEHAINFVPHVVFYIQYIYDDDQWLCTFNVLHLCTLNVLSHCTYLILVQLTTPFWHSQTRQGLWAPTSPWVRFIWGHAAETWTFVHHPHHRGSGSSGGTPLKQRHSFITHLTVDQVHLGTRRWNMDIRSSPTSPWVRFIWGHAAET